jgi:trk system potassium uptake protein TrkA
MIAGGSREAFYLGQLLQEHNVSATLLVQDRPRAQELAEKLHKALILNGDATDVELLEVEGVGDMDAFVALTDEDRTNILSALVAKHAGAKQVVTLVNKIEYVSLARAIGLDAAVSPRLSAANAILRQVRSGSVTRVATFKDTDAEMISFTVSSSSPLVGKPLMEVQFPEGTIVAAILRGDAVIVPRGHDQLKTGDTAIVFTLQEAVSNVTNLFPT